MINERASGLLVAFTLPAVPESPRAARVHLRAALTTFGLQELVDDAEAIVSELVANAWRHARSPAGVALIRTSSELITIIGDSSPVFPVMSSVEDSAESGRGLVIVDAITGGRWGWQQSGAGKLVWAGLRLAHTLRGESHRVSESLAMVVEVGEIWTGESPATAGLTAETA